MWWQTQERKLREKRKMRCCNGSFWWLPTLSRFYKAIRVKCEQMWTCATCLWLLNNLKAIVLEDILVHMSHKGLRFGLTLLLNPLGPFQVSSSAGWIRRQTKCCYSCYCDLCDAYNSKMYVVNLTFPSRFSYLAVHKVHLKRTRIWRHTNLTVAESARDFNLGLTDLALSCISRAMHARAYCLCPNDASCFSHLNLAVLNEY